MTKEDYKLQLWKEYLEANKWMNTADKAVLEQIGLLYLEKVEALYRFYQAVMEGEVQKSDEQTGLKYYRKGEYYVLSRKENTCRLTPEQLKEYLQMMIELFEDIHPLGTVVDLKKEELKEKLPVDEPEQIRMVITHRYIGAGEHGIYFPYGATIYPIGMPGENKILNFTPALIEKVVHEGFRDEQEEAYVYLMKQELLIKKKQKSMGFASEEECRKYNDYLKRGGHTPDAENRE